MKSTYFNSHFTHNSVLTAEAEDLARLGWCPSCEGHSLKLKHTGAGLLFHYCSECTCIVVLTQEQE